MVTFVILVIVCIPGVAYVLLRTRQDLRDPAKREQTLRTMQALDATGRGMDRAAKVTVGTAIPVVGAYQLVKRGQRKRDERLAKLIVAEQAKLQHGERRNA